MSINPLSAIPSVAIVLLAIFAGHPAAAQSACYYSPPRCQEDQVVSWFNKCLNRDDSYFRDGHWFRHPGHRTVTYSVTPQCKRYKVITRSGHCRAVKDSYHAGGYWYAR